MSRIPWWGLPLVAAVFALAGAAAACLVAARADHLLSRRWRTRRWYEERKNAYVQLLAGFERATFRLRASFEAGEKPPTVLTYLDEIGPALMPVRLLASGPVRSAALAVHLQLERLHGEMNPTGVPGVQPQTHFRELIAQVPLVMQQLEAAIREELGIRDRPPSAPPPLPGWLRWPVATRQAQDDGAEEPGQRDDQRDEQQVAAALAGRRGRRLGR